MLGYVRLPQWYFRVKNIDDLSKPKGDEMGDAGAIDKLLGYPKVEVSRNQPSPHTGEIVMRVEDDGTLVKIADNYDSSG